MSLTITCGRCGQRFTVAAHLYGQRVRCTSCQGILDIPYPSSQTESGDLSSSFVPNAGDPRASQRPIGSARTTGPSHSERRLILLCSGIVGGVLLLLSCAILASGLFQGDSSPRSEDETAASSHVDAPRSMQDDTTPARQVDVVQAHVGRVVAAVCEGDIEVAITYTHPRLVEMLGGEAKLRTGLKSLMSRMQQDDIALESLAFPDDLAFLTTDKHEFAIVPMKTVTRINDKRIESIGYQLGIREIGASKWYFLDGSRLKSQGVGKFFPDFPSDYQLPETSQRIL